VLEDQDLAAVRPHTRLVPAGQRAQTGPTAPRLPPPNPWDSELEPGCGASINTAERLPSSRDGNTPGDGELGGGPCPHPYTLMISVVLSSFSCRPGEKENVAYLISFSSFR